MSETLHDRWTCFYQNANLFGHEWLNFQIQKYFTYFFAFLYIEDTICKLYILEGIVTLAWYLHTEMNPSHDWFAKWEGNIFVPAHSEEIRT